MNINQWLGCGRITKDADFLTTKKGTPMAKFRLAVNDRRNDSTLFLNVLTFGKTAEVLKEHLKKGRLVGVQGKLKIDDYQDDEGNTRNSVCVMADNIELGPKSEGKSEVNTTPFDQD
jgi:single-strand DNA-binding protein